MSAEQEEKAEKGKGYWGRILNIDLSKKEAKFEDLPDEIYKNYLSGVGLGAKILFDRMKPGADPLGPDNILGFVSGLLTDTGSLFTGRFLVVGKSPLTGGWGDANCGGKFSPGIKRCKIDGIFVTGKSDKPVYIYTDGETAEIKDAADLWGMDAIEAEKKLEERHGKRARVATIGPSGEKLSLISGIVNDGGRIAARSGLGAVMGSKKLKAVVADGKTRAAVANKEKIQELSKGFSKRIEALKGMRRFLGDGLLGLVGKITARGQPYMRQPGDLWRLLLSKFGTPALTAMSAESGDSPIKNWGGVGNVDFPLKKSQKIGAESVLKYEVKKYGCYSCPILCGSIMKKTDGRFKFEEQHKPEYETICAFGGLLLNDDLDTIFEINDIVNRAGIDSISCGAVVGFAIECFEKGILTKEDTGGLELKWGSTDSVVALTKKIVAREGLGDVLADGVKRAAEKIGKGSEAYAVHCGGQEPAMHDPKFDPGFGLSYYVEPTPGRHTISSLQYLDMQVLEKKFSAAKKPQFLSSHKERFRCDNKGKAFMVDSCYKMLVDAVGMCLFGTQVGGNLPLCEWINAATGWNISNDDYLVIGERIEQLRHSFNVREGLNPIRDFKPHGRVYGETPLTKGPHKGITLDMNMLARSFYREMHWDVETGKPELGNLKKLGMNEVIKTFYPEA